jgi:hypothetical protein
MLRLKNGLPHFALHELDPVSPRVGARRDDSKELSIGVVQGHSVVHGNAGGEPLADEAMKGSSSTDLGVIVWAIAAAEHPQPVE